MTTQTFMEDPGSTLATPPPPWDTSFPVDTYRDAAIHLRRPFDHYAVQFRALDGSKGERLNCAAYVTARTVIDRLNLVCPHLWDAPSYEPVPGGLRCTLRIGGLVRSDVGWSAGTATAMTLKALYSDAFKRAAVHFGVAVSLYSLPRLVLTIEERHIWSKKTGEKDRYGNPKFRYGITTAGMSELRARYERWLSVQDSFGPALSHGHLEGSHDPEDEPDDIAGGDVALAGEGDVKTLRQAAKGLVLSQVRMAFVAAGIPAPERKTGCFENVASSAVGELAKQLQKVPRREATP